MKGLWGQSSSAVGLADDPCAGRFLATPTGTRRALGASLTSRALASLPAVVLAGDPGFWLGRCGLGEGGAPGRWEEDARLFY